MSNMTRIAALLIAAALVLPAGGVEITQRAEHARGVDFAHGPRQRVAEVGDCASSSSMRWRRTHTITMPGMASAKLTQ